MENQEKWKLHMVKVIENKKQKNNDGKSKKEMLTWFQEWLKHEKVLCPTKWQRDKHRTGSFQSISLTSISCIPISIFTFCFKLLKVWLGNGAPWIIYPWKERHIHRLIEKLIDWQCLLASVTFKMMAEFIMNQSSK